MWTSPPGRTREKHVLGSIFILLGSIHLSSDRIFCSFWAPPSLLLAHVVLRCLTHFRGGRPQHPLGPGMGT